MNSLKKQASKNLKVNEIRQILSKTIGQRALSGKKIIVIIPDNTRSGPAGLFFRQLYELLWKKVKSLDFLIALGTHQLMSKKKILKHLEISENEMDEKYTGVNIFNHHWENPDTFITAGILSKSEVEELSNNTLSMEVPIKINKMIYDYDHIIICGPVFPHEVAGFSGGYKYFIPGIAGQEVIDFTHWLGAIETSIRIIGKKETSVRAAINKAASFIDIPTSFICYVVNGNGLAGVFAGEPNRVWNEAVNLSSQIHINYYQKSFKKVLSVIPEMYDEIWTGAKGMYKLDPVIADGGEVIIYAPHITEISFTHGKFIKEVGYHVRDYFLKQWDRFKSYPWGILAHSTHLKGQGTYDAETGIEKSRIKVTLATGISREECESVNLGYLDPDSINIEEWKNCEEESILFVPKAGEMLYRLNE